MNASDAVKEHMASGFRRTLSSAGLFAGIGLGVGLASAIFSIALNRYIHYGLYRISIYVTRTYLNEAVLFSTGIGIILILLARATLGRQWTVGGLCALALDTALLAEMIFLVAPLAGGGTWYSLGILLVSLYALRLFHPGIRNAHFTNKLRACLLIASLLSFAAWQVILAALNKEVSFVIRQLSITNIYPKGLTVSPLSVLRLVMGINFCAVTVLFIIESRLGRARRIVPYYYGMLNAALPVIVATHFDRTLTKVLPALLPKAGALWLWQNETSARSLLATNGAFFAFCAAMGLFAFLSFRTKTFSRLSSFRGGERTARLGLRFLSVTLIIIAAVNLAAMVPAGKPGFNLLLISIDTLRADHLGCYGYARPTSPAIDRVAGNGVTFKTVVTPQNATSAGHASILTGLYTINHGVRHNCWPLRESALTLAEYLRNFGYTTGGVVSQFNLEGKLGFSQGFQAYDDTSRALPMGEEAGNTTRRALSWLRKNHRSRFFLFIHYFDPHLDYAPPPRYRNMFGPAYRGPFTEAYTLAFNKELERTHAKLAPRDVQRVIALYDAEVRYVDDNISRILSFLDSHGIRENTIVAITADHGEGLYEHGYFNHGTQFLYNGELMVPLIISCPRLFRGPVSVADAVQLTDIFPTITRMLVSKSPADRDGIDLAPLMEGRAGSPDRPCYSESHITPVPKKTYSVLKGNWKYICFSHANPKAQDQLYDLSNDAGEKDDLLKSSTRGKSLWQRLFFGRARKGIQTKYLETSRELNSLLREWLRGGRAAEKIQHVLDEQRASQLKALGYMQ